ncbi:MAG: cobalt-precorrin-5B (C(1))-methyltransferase CbiD [Tissierellia bacterium]|nr:cobalt-precorrin-5B (C(1))-methyltransferase CbiD [Tissierellia bacterium]
MKLDEFVIVDGKKMRCGYTTGSCALGATTAACRMLLGEEDLSYVKIDTPAGILLTLPVSDIQRTDDSVTCCIIKDAGDDPDVTDGIGIYATVKKRKDNQIILDGGKGVGRIMRTGLFGEIGEAAINPVPKKLILETLEKYSKTGLECTIFVPEGEAIGKKTFNRYIGIEGGISIIGTKGIVYPMSEEALIKTIYLEVDMIVEKFGTKEILLTPGNYGIDIAKELNLNIPVVKISNFIGDVLKYVKESGFQKIVLLGHIGKFSKLSIGIFNTHSKIADTRLEAFVYYLALMGASQEFLAQVNSMITAETAYDYVLEHGYKKLGAIMAKGCNQRVKRYLKDEDIDVETIIYSMNQGVISC